MNTYHVVIEIPENTSIKYEYDETLGRLVLDRILPTSMAYPVSYGYVLGTMGKDGDPLDAVVFLSKVPAPGTVVKCKPIGVMDMEDEEGHDAKVVFVPVEKVDFEYGKWESLDDVPLHRKNQITHFFEHYKDLEKEKWVKIAGWQDASAAVKLLDESRVGEEASK